VNDTLRPKTGKKRELKRKRAQGAASRQEGKANRVRIQNKLGEKPWGLGELAREVGLSNTNTWKHLKQLLKQGFVKKTLSIDGRVVYEITSKNEALENYVNFTLDMIRFTYGNELYPDIEERIRSALLEDMERKTAERKKKEEGREED
jgi:predicted DNA-binding transcriptional regulator